jgi:hypothetical protein
MRVAYNTSVFHINPDPEALRTVLFSRKKWVLQSIELLFKSTCTPAYRIVVQSETGELAFVLRGTQQHELKVQKHRYVTASKELNVMRELKRIGIRVPEILLDVFSCKVQIDGVSTYLTSKYFVCSFLDGVPIDKYLGRYNNSEALIYLDELLACLSVLWKKKFRFYGIFNSRLITSTVCESVVNYYRSRIRTLTSALVGAALSKENQSQLISKLQFVNTNKISALAELPISHLRVLQPVLSHGDLSAGNILVSEDGMHSLIDLGNAGAYPITRDLTVLFSNTGHGGKLHCVEFWIQRLNSIFHGSDITKDVVDAVIMSSNIEFSLIQINNIIYNADHTCAIRRKSIQADIENLLLQ